MDPADGREVSTIFLGGFPYDAQPRELDNLVRFFPGYVTSSVSTNRGVTMFALFDIPENAQAAIEVLNGQVFDRNNPAELMRASMAKSNMRSSASGGGGGGGGGGAAHHGPPPARGSAAAWAAPRTFSQPPPPSYPPPPGHPGTGPMGNQSGQKRPRIYEDPNQIDTVASVGAMEAGFDENTLRGIFESFPGFMHFKANPRMGGAFVKFASPAHAVQALQYAKDDGVPCEMAKSSMSVPGESRPPQAPAAAQQIYPPAQRITTIGHVPQQPIPPAGLGVPLGGGGGGCGGGGGGGGGGGLKRPRIPEDPNQVDTVASVGAAEAGFDESALHSFYSSLPGFVAFKGNPRMGGGFAKFSCASEAHAAVARAKESGIPADIARSSMSA